MCENSNEERLKNLEGQVKALKEKINELDVIVSEILESRHPADELYYE